MSEGNDLRRGVGVGFRLGTELTVSTLVGAVMGYALDWFLGTKPWLMVLGVFLVAPQGVWLLTRQLKQPNFQETTIAKMESRNKTTKRISA